MATKKALIIGCGIAGPAVALFLQRAGITAEIYEARSAADDYAGLFLTVATNGMAVLQTLGLQDLVQAEGFPTPRLVIWNSSGKQLGEVAVGTPANTGAVSVTIKRGVLQRILREAVLRQGITVAFGKQLQTIAVTDAQGVVATFADGTTAAGDFLIGCDGIHSRVRQIVDPAAPPPTYTGLLSGGGFAHSATLSPTPETMHMIFGQRAFFGYLVKPNGEIYWFENHEQRGDPTRATMTALGSAAWQQKLLALHAADQPLIREIILATHDEIGMYPIYDIPTLPRWRQGPVVLLGDAAHATSPSAGQGAALALEDALVLAQCVRDIPQPAAAFAAYEQRRRKRAEQVVNYSRARGSNKALTNPVARWLRDLTMPFILRHFAKPSALAWLYNYEVDWNQRVFCK